MRAKGEPPESAETRLLYSARLCFARRRRKDCYKAKVLAELRAIKIAC